MSLLQACGLQTRAYYYCLCPAILNVSLEERAYLQDRQLKAGSKGSFQMAWVDQAAVKRLQASKYRQLSHYSEKLRKWLPTSNLEGGDPPLMQELSNKDI